MQDDVSSVESNYYSHYSKWRHIASIYHHRFFSDGILTTFRIKRHSTRLALHLRFHCTAALSRDLQQTSMHLNGAMLQFSAQRVDGSAIVHWKSQRTLFSVHKIGRAPRGQTPSNQNAYSWDVNVPFRMHFRAILSILKTLKQNWKWTVTFPKNEELATMYGRCRTQIWEVLSIARYKAQKFSNHLTEQLYTGV